MSQLQASTNSYSTVERSLPSLACKINTAKLSKTRHSDRSCGEQPDSGSLKSLRTVWEQFEPTEVLQRRCRHLPFQWLISGFKSSPPTAVPSDAISAQGLVLTDLDPSIPGSLDPWIPPFLRLWSLRSFPNESAAILPFLEGSQHCQGNTMTSCSSAFGERLRWVYIMSHFDA